MLNNLKELEILLSNLPGIKNVIVSNITNKLWIRFEITNNRGLFVISKAMNFSYPSNNFIITLYDNDFYFGINYIIKSKRSNKLYKQSGLLIKCINFYLQDTEYLKLYGLENINEEIKIKARKNKLKTIWKN
jgi:hypothetical protein